MTAHPLCRRCATTRHTAEEIEPVALLGCCPVSAHIYVELGLLCYGSTKVRPMRASNHPSRESPISAFQTQRLSP